MATFGKTPPRDPLAEMKLAISDLQLLHDDTMDAFKREVEASLAYGWSVEWSVLEVPKAERYQPISQARRDDAALPQTRFGDYPTD